MKFPKRILLDLRQGENLDLYLTMAVSLVFISLSVMGVSVSTNLILSLVVVSLGLLSVGILGNRYRLDMIMQLNAVRGEERFQKAFSSDTQKQIEDRMRKGRELILVAVAGGRTLQLHYHLLESRLDAGSVVKAILINPESPACEMVAKREYRPVDLASQRSEIASSLAQLAKLKQTTSGKLEIRLIDYPLAHGGIIIDPDSDDGVLYLWNYSFKTREQNRPKFVLRPADGYWYEHFKEETEAAWNNATSWSGITS